MTAAKVSGDYSKYPGEIRDIVPFIYGELCELRSNWGVYEELFMTEEALTRALADSVGPLLGVTQRLLEESFFMSIGCLTDKNSSGNKNLSFYTLAEKAAAWNSTVSEERLSRLDSLGDKLARIRKHRNKRLAHFDLRTSLGEKSLPIVTFTEIKEVMKELEDLLNLITAEACETTIFFDTLGGHAITGTAEVSAYKVRAYDNLVSKGVIPKLEWRQHAIKK